MTWTPEHSILLAREICGYEVQTSPKGAHYVIEDGRTRPLPDFPNDPGETLTALEAYMLVRPLARAEIDVFERNFTLNLTRQHGSGAYGSAPRLTQVIAWALWAALTEPTPTNPK